MENLVRYKGKIRRKKAVEKGLKFVERVRLQRLAAKMTENCSVKNSIIDGARIVEPSVLAERMNCINCHQELSLKNIVQEKRMGIHSIWTAVDTGKKHVSSDGQTFYDLNSKVVLGKFELRFYLYISIGSSHCTNLW